VLSCSAIDELMVSERGDEKEQRMRCCGAC